MILLVSGAHAIKPHPHLGWLLTPRNGTSPRTVVAAGVPWAADNDCYQRLDRTAYIAMLRRIACASDRRRLLFVTVPDVVGDARATLRRWSMWQPALAYYGLPAAFVAQDGQEDLLLPWDAMSALFIGGTTAWKEGPHAGRLIQEAKARGKWVHVGRVTTLRRMRLMDALGADSFDGSIFSRMADKYVPWMLRGLDHHQHGFVEVLCS